VGLTNVYTAVFTNVVPLEELVFKQWDKAFGGNDYDRLTCLTLATDGGYILGGYSYSGTNGNKSSPNAQTGIGDYWIIKIDSNGNKIWERTFGGLGLDLLYTVNNTADGGYILGGESSSVADGNKTSPLYGGADFWAIK